MPASIVVADEGDALWLIGKMAEKRRFEELSSLTLQAFPVLASWIVLRPMLLLEHAPAWERIVLILPWFVAHPRPQRYLRELDIPGVDSKFIETRKALLAELLDQLLPSEAIDMPAVGTRQFETRYGLLSKPVLIRFCLLDVRHHIGGLSDLSVPVAQFVALRSMVERIFITDNEINGRAFPEAADSMVIFGGGYGVDRLREYLPQARSMLMGIATLEAHRLLWGSEEQHKRHVGNLTRLTDEEQVLFHRLRDNTLDECIRMEQERLGFHWIRSAI